MKILHVTPAFYPATYWGGSVYSVYGLCNALAQIASVELRVLTTNAAGPSLSQRVEVSEFPTRYLGGYDVFFTKRVLGKEIAPALIARLWSMVRWADVVHLTRTYSFPTIPTLAACCLLGKPLIWSPRGALQASHEWSGVRRPHLKKVWERLCAVIMPKHCVLHVTSEEEKSASLARLPCVNAVVIPNGVEVPFENPTRAWQPEGCLRLLFIGRLEPKKGIENLLKAITTLDEHVSLAIYGVGEECYSTKLRKLVDRLGLAARVRFGGEVRDGEKSAAFWNADVCVVPSFTENFGMVVAEALAHGLPVIASRGTPWAEIESRGCGLWVENLPGSLAESINMLRKRDLGEMGRKGRRWMQEQFDWGLVSKQMLRLYSNLTNSSVQ